MNILMEGLWWDLLSPLAARQLKQQQPEVRIAERSDLEQWRRRCQLESWRRFWVVGESGKLWMWGWQYENHRICEPTARAGWKVNIARGCEQQNFQWAPVNGGWPEGFGNCDVRMVNFHITSFKQVRVSDITEADVVVIVTERTWGCKLRCRSHTRLRLWHKFMEASHSL